MADPQYVFLPYLRRGLAQQIREVDALGGAPPTGIPGGRPRLPAELVVGARPVDGSATQRLSFTKDLQLVGPGDVLSVRSAAFIRSVPAPGTADFLADRFAFVELYDEDLPWRYTPAAPAGDRLRPWLFLLVLEPKEATEVTKTGRGPEYPPYLRLAPGVALPSPTETWAWAHVQVAMPDAGAGATVASVQAALDGAPDACLARLLSPRRLVPATRYVGYVVPAFETGRRAGLGADSAAISAIPAQQAAWGTGDQGGLKLPYYHRFEFGTSDDADLEELVSRLRPNPGTEALRGRPLNVTSPGFGLDGLATAPTALLAGALEPIPTSGSPLPAAPLGAAFTRRLRELLDAGDALAEATASPTAHPYDGAPGFPALFADDPMVVPPVYGRWQAGGWRLTDTARVRSWITELNLDPRYRVAAGIGAAIVRDREDELVERAFKQLQGVAELQRARREADLAVAVGQSLFERHLQAADDERTLTVTAAMHGGLRSTATSTIQADVEASKVPRATMSAAFKKVVRPGGKLERALTRATGAATTAGAGTLRASLIDGVNTERVSASPPMAEPATAIDATEGALLIEHVRTAFKRDVPSIARWVFAEAALRMLFEHPQMPFSPQWRDSHRMIANVILTERVVAEGDIPAVRAKVDELRGGLVGMVEAAAPAQSVVRLAAASYKAAFGDAPGKSYRGARRQGGTAVGSARWLLFMPDGAAVPTDGIARMASPYDLEAYQDAYGTFYADKLGGTGPAGPPRLTGVAAVAQQIRAAVQPSTTVRKRVTARLGRPGVRVLDRGRTDAARADAAPILAYPRFTEPLVDDLRRIALDHLLPNLAALPPDTITLLRPNAPFIEALLAGANHELARELLWREFPTDLRGSYFLNFWDASDAGGGDDAPPLDQWTQPLGKNLTAATRDVTVLVIRGALVRQFPNVVVYAQRAMPPATPGGARQLSEHPDDLVYPSLRARLTPDAIAVAFPVRPEDAVKDPGWFIVFKERAGELGFGMDDGAAVPLTTWDDLNFSHAGVAPGGYVSLAGAAALATSAPSASAWGATSADMADILFQLPFLMARHASELL